MLERLYVRNVALIEEADVEFDGKFNVLSGETGSGKSVILDSINFVLGSKADKTMIRYGTNEAVVKAEFSVEPASEVCSVLGEMDIECDGEVIISRRMTVEGKGSIKINGNTVTAAMLKRVASRLVDVHGQSEHFFLLYENNQLNLIDSLCGSEMIELKGKLGELLSQKKEFLSKKAALGGSEWERAQKLDLLNFQINEIESANLTVGEGDKLRAKKKFFDNAERVITAISAVQHLLGDDCGCVDMLTTAKRQISAVSDYGEEFSSLSDRLENLSIEAEDLAETVSDIADGLVIDENEARYVEERLTLIKGLTKKYGGDEENVLAYLNEAREKRDSLLSASEELEKLDGKIVKANGDIYKICMQITELRKAVSAKFCTAVEEQLRSLNIPNAKFYVEFAPYTEESCEANANGADRLCFMFSANRGEPPKPLSKVISGGEMSRFMLAVKTQFKGLNGISTYIFDEIDAGISGVTARTVADKFVAISENTQIIAVSHLPQVCAAASAQYLITKSDANGEKTITNIRRLGREERIDEIVRLTGSISTAAARTHAEELLSQFNN